MKTTERRVTAVGVNAHLLSGEAGYRRAGIHHYIAQVLRHLPLQEDNLRPVVFTRFAGDLADVSGLTLASSRWPTERRSVRILWEQLVWPWQAWRQQLDLLHSMAFVTPVLAPCPTIVTIYDLSFLHFPERFPRLQRWYLTSQTGRSCRQARRVITISESSRQDVHQFFGIPLERIAVVYPGVDGRYHPLSAPEIAAFRQRENLPERFVLHVGTLQPRKNISLLLDAFAQLKDPDLHLVLAGGKGWLFDEIFRRVQTLGLEKRVRFTGYVPDEDLPLWYNAAALFVFPSVYEGFGMPVVEAMACGLPVVASCSSSIPEATGDAGLLFDPHNAVELAERMASVLNDPALSARMRQQGITHAANFSWEQAGRQTAVVYRQAWQAK
ncbi:MAG: glycosyltransferase family 4 protein [Ardenticatenaceae bacterium]|nr:glycosyltransferase family 4 protein [Ardenticatenaceae bacterium]